MARGPDSIAGGEAPVRRTTISKGFLDMIVEADKIREALVTSLPYLGGILKQNWELGIGKMPTVLGKSISSLPHINIPMPAPAPSTYYPPPLPTTQYQPLQPQHTPTSTHWSGSSPSTSQPPADTAESKREEQGGGGGGGKSGQRGGGGGKGGRDQGARKEQAPKTLHHCQACGRRDAWHRDGSVCPALQRGSLYANPDWATVTWEASEMGKRALASGYTFAHAPPDPNRKWVEYET
jgi:hypothetical protein